MVTKVEAKNLADLYDLPFVEWSAVTARFDRSVTQAPGTRWTGSPHVLVGYGQRRRLPARDGDRRDVGRRNVLVRDR
jgi:hypothetical protein